MRHREHGCLARAPGARPAALTPDAGAGPELSEVLDVRGIEARSRPSASLRGSSNPSWCVAWSARCTSAFESDETDHVAMHKGAALTKALIPAFDVPT